MKNEIIKDSTYVEFMSLLKEYKKRKKENPYFDCNYNNPLKAKQFLKRIK